MPDTAPPPVVLVETAAAVTALAPQLLQMPIVPIDLESNGLHAYRNSLCTLQIGDLQDGVVKRVWVVDTLKLGAAGLAPLQPVLAATGPEKIVHDVSFDGRMLASSGLPLGNVFDTALAARFLGLPQQGLSALVLARFGVTLSKVMQHHDWGARPIIQKAMPYLAMDVAFLPGLRDQLKKEVGQKGVAEDLDVETNDRLAQGQLPSDDDRLPYVRVKQADDLGPLELAILREVAAVREASAKALDVPPFKVAPNEALVALAVQKPTALSAVQAVPGLGRGRGAAIAKELFEAVARGLAAKDIPAEERLKFFTPGPKLPRDEVKARREREQRLSTWRATQAAKRGVDIQAVLPGHVLQSLADAERTLEAIRAVPGLGAHRAARDAETLLQVLLGGKLPAAAPVQGKLL
jgi:ribonuclease D